jgi:hypothetical protein
MPQMKPAIFEKDLMAESKNPRCVATAGVLFF